MEANGSEANASLNERRARWVGWMLTAVGWRHPATNRRLAMPPNYETSLDACLELIEKAKELGWECKLMWHSDNTCTFELMWPGAIGTPRQYFEEEAETPALAICKAIDKLIDRLEGE